MEVFIRYLESVGHALGAASPAPADAVDPEWRVRAGAPRHRSAGPLQQYAAAPRGFIAAAFAGYELRRALLAT